MLRCVRNQKSRTQQRKTRGSTPLFINLTGTLLARYLVYFCSGIDMLLQLASQTL